MHDPGAQPTEPGRRFGKHRWTATLLLFIMGATWGLQFALLKIAAEDGLSEIGILAVSLLALAPLYAIMLLWRREYFSPTGRHLVFFLISGLLGYLIPLGAAIHVAPHLPAGLIALIASLTPVITVLASIALGTEHVSSLRIVAVILGVLAAVVVLWSDLELPGVDVTYWMLIAFIAPLAYGFDGIYVAARWPEELSSLQVVTGEALVAGLVLLPLYLASGDTISFAGTWSDGHWAIVWFVAASLIEVFLFYYLIRTSGPVAVSFGSVIALVAGIFWGFVIFGERLSAPVWVAAGLLVLALVCVTIGAEEKQP